MIKKNNIGSSFDSFLKEENIYIETKELAIKEILAEEIKKYMEENNITKTTLAKQMHTSRAAINRILDTKNVSITLHSILNVANVLGKEVIFQLV